MQYKVEELMDINSLPVFMTCMTSMFLGSCAVSKVPHKNNRDNTEGGSMRA